jgi:hypothetical protein
MKNVSFFWPPMVAAHFCKGFARVQQLKLLAPEKLSLGPVFSYVHQILQCLQTVQKNIPIKIPFLVETSKAQRADI